MTTLRTISFQNRRSHEMESLVVRHGGVCDSAPAMREVPLEATPEVRAFVPLLAAGKVDALILLTGVGTRAMAKAVSDTFDESAFCDLLRKTQIVVRGPKPVAVLKQWGLKAAAVAAAPNTWREVLVAFDQLALSAANAVVGVQEYGVSNDALVQALGQRCKTVLPLPVYRWAPPEDLAPLDRGLAGVVARAYDVAFFSSANQVASVMKAAEARGLASAFRDALGQMAVVSIGPVCTEALVAHEIAVDLEPAHSKMGHMVKEAMANGREILDRKKRK